MNDTHLQRTCATILLLTLTIALSAAEPATPPAPAMGTNAVKFTPPKSKTIGLKRQVNAGSRSGTHVTAVPIALVPDGLGLSSYDQPVLWWFLTQPTTNKVEFTLNRSFETLVKVELPVPAGAGLQRVAIGTLARDVSVRLSPGAPYEWAIRIKQGDDPAAHPVTIGWVEYRPLEPALKARTAKTVAAQQPALFAAEGYWYDALTLLATPAPGPQLQPLLHQVGLTNVVIAPR